MSVGGSSFSSVRKAKEALRARANEILDNYLAVIKQAAAAGDYETAVKGFQHLLDHMPDEDGERILDVSADKKQIESTKGNSGPTIQIGLQIGGLKSLPPAIDIIEIRPDADPD